MMADSGHYTTWCGTVHEFSAYDDTFEPKCQISDEDPTYQSADVHQYHDKGNKIANTTNDLLIGIWTILQRQASWLTGKIGSLDANALNQAISQPGKANSLSQEDFNKLSKCVIDAVKVANSESGKGTALPHQDLDKLEQAVRETVTKASREIGDQNREILVKLSGFKEEVERVLSDQNLDDKFVSTEQVIRDCIADVEQRIAKLQKLGRDILEEVSNSSGKTDIEKLVLENNKILKRFEDENLIKNIKTPGLEQLVRKEDLNELENKIDPKTLVRRVDLKQETILEKLKEQHDMLENLSKAVDRDADIAEELAKAKEHRLTHPNVSQGHE